MVVTSLIDTLMSMDTLFDIDLGRLKICHFFLQPRISQDVLSLAFFIEYRSEYVTIGHLCAKFI